MVKGYVWTQAGTTKHKAWVAWYLCKYMPTAARHEPRLVLPLAWRAIRHDLSKYRWSEAKWFASTIFELGKVEYGTPEYRALLDKIRPAITLHYQRNSHHPEYWGSVEQMPRVDLIEMVADWKAASKRTANGDLKRSIQMNRERWQYDEATEVAMRDIAVAMGAV
jgi:hypothetical protein